MTELFISVRSTAGHLSHRQGYSYCQEWHSILECLHGAVGGGGREIRCSLRNGYIVNNERLSIVSQPTSRLIPVHVRHLNVDSQRNRMVCTNDRSWRVETAKFRTHFHQNRSRSQHATETERRSSGCRRIAMRVIVAPRPDCAPNPGSIILSTPTNTLVLYPSSATSCPAVSPALSRNHTNTRSARHHRQAVTKNVQNRTYKE